MKNESIFSMAVTGVIKNVAVALLVGAALLAVSSSAHAVRFSFLEEKFTQGPILMDVIIVDFLEEIPRPRLRLDPSDRVHQRMVDILDAGFPFKTREDQDRIA